jgi:uncharacterized protein
MRRAFAFLLVVVGSTMAFAALQFPALSGRVVDEAHILSEATVQSLDQMLGDYERGTTNQVVVATLQSLQGTTIDDFGYQLGRTWQIGQKDKNNGALLIVAPHEKKVRIEVGYGLEPLLTDAASSAIVNGIILPAFRDGDMEKGIIEGTKAMLSVLGGKGLPESAQNEQGSLPAFLIMMMVLGLFIWFSRRHPLIALALLASNSSRFGGDDSGLGSGGGGFSGGGGSFGGGGASGSW